MQIGEDSSEAELALSAEESLPWLESDEAVEAGAVDSARIVGFAAILLGILALALAAVWWFSRSGQNRALQADGSTIAAPVGPYKEKPGDAGGKQFAGTGDIAPAVGEGQRREGVVKEEQPSVSAGADAGPSIARRSSNDKIVPIGAVGVQVGAYATRAKAEAGWRALRGATKLLDGFNHRIIKGEADIGTVYRLQAVASDLARANRLCRDLKGDGLACQVKK